MNHDYSSNSMNAPCMYKNHNYKSLQNESQNWDFFESNLDNQSSSHSWWTSCSHKSCESSSQSAYYVDINSDDNINAHLTAYYADQHSSEYVDQSHNKMIRHVYTNKVFSKCTYSCWACEKIFLLVSQLKYHINETHYNYLVSVYNDAVTLISYTTVQISIDKLFIKSKVVCLDSEILHTLVNCSLIADHIHLADKNLQIHSVAYNSNSKLIFFKHVNLHLYIHSDDSKSKTFIACKTYLMNELDVNMLMSMNVMQSEDMILNCEKDKLIMNSHYNFTMFFSRFMKENNSKQAVVYHYKITDKMTTWCSDEFTVKMTSKNISNQVILHVKMHIKTMLTKSSCACCTCMQIFQLSNNLHEHLYMTDYVTSHHSWQSWWSHHTDRSWRKIVDEEIIMNKTMWDILMQRIIAENAVILFHTSIASMCDKNVIFHCFGEHLSQTHRVQWVWDSAIRLRLCDKIETLQKNSALESLP